MKGLLLAWVKVAHDMKGLCVVRVHEHYCTHGSIVRKRDLQKDFQKLSLARAGNTVSLAGVPSWGTGGTVHSALEWWVMGTFSFGPTYHKCHISK
jgi:hypothetical protein